MDEEKDSSTPSFVKQNESHFRRLYETLILKNINVSEHIPASFPRFDGGRKFKYGAEQSFVAPSMYRYDTLPAPKFSYTPEDVKNVIMRLQLDDKKTVFPVIPETMRQDRLP